MIRGAKIVLGISGSIAAYKAYDLIRLLQKDDALLKCVLTANGGRFVNTVTLECLLQDAVYTDLWGDYPDKRAVHIALAEWADLVVIVPASADCMAKVALGIADDLLTSILLATHAPVLFVPAMHTNMWNNAITKTNVRTLKRRGFRFVQPASGTLSDGTQGVGHIAPHEEIIEAIAKCLTVKTKGKRIKDKGKKKKRRE